MQDFSIPLRLCSSCKYWQRGSATTDPKTKTQHAFCEQEKDPRTKQTIYKATHGSDKCLQWSKIDGTS